MAGSGSSGYQNGKALDAQFQEPIGVAVDNQGRVFVADYKNNRIRVIVNGLVSDFAGDGTSGFADGPSSKAKFKRPHDIAVGSNGAVYIADTDNFRIRKIENGQVTTIAGTGKYGFLDGPAKSSLFHYVWSIDVGTDGAIYLAGLKNKRIRVIKNGVVSTLAGNGNEGYKDGKADQAEFVQPTGVAVGKNGAVFVSDYTGHRIRKIEGGIVSTVAGTGTKGFVDGVASIAQFKAPYEIAVGKKGELYVAEAGNNRIRLIENGTVSTIAGSNPGYMDGTGSKALFNTPYSITLDSIGRLYVADSKNYRIRMIKLGGK